MSMAAAEDGKSTPRFRVSLVHPLHEDRRIQVTAKTRKALDDRCEHIRGLRWGLEHGQYTRAEVEAMLAGPNSAKLGDVVRAYADRHPLDYRVRVHSALGRQLASLAPLPLSDCTEARMRAWVEELAPTFARNTIQQSYQFMSAALRSSSLAFPWGTWRPALQKARPPRVPEKTADVGELCALLRAAAERDARQAIAVGGGMSDLMIRVTILALCGLRKAEACALGWDHADYRSERPTIRVRYQTRDGWRARGGDRPTDPTKTRSDLHVRLHPCAVLALEWQAKDLDELGWLRADGPVFPRDDGDWRNTPEIMRGDTWHGLVRAAGLPNPDAWVVHSLRHSLAALEAAGGADLEQIRTRTRHASLGQAERYTRGARASLPPSRIPSGDGAPVVEATPDEASLWRTLQEGRALILEARAKGPEARREKYDRNRALALQVKRAGKATRIAVGGLSLGQLARADWMSDEECATEIDRRVALARGKTKQAEKLRGATDAEAAAAAARAATRVRRSFARAKQRERAREGVKS